MDEYLTKPVKPEELSAALNRLVEAVASTEAAARSETASARSEATAVVTGDAAPEAGFDFTAALNYVGGDRALLDELLGIFVEDAPVRMETIRRAIAGREAAELTREAHTIKGALKVIGATTAAGLAQGLEALGRDGNMGEADKLAVALEREMDRLMQSLLASRRG
jgi:HPt (histidine-containing phosphotransfer) domain-containing protein